MTSSDDRGSSLVGKKAATDIVLQWEFAEKLNFELDICVQRTWVAPPDGTMVKVLAFVR